MKQATAVDRLAPALSPTFPFSSDLHWHLVTEGAQERRQTFFGREVEELIHFVRLQLNLRDDCLA